MGCFLCLLSTSYMNNILFSSSYDYTVKIWDITNEKVIHSLSVNSLKNQTSTYLSTLLNSSNDFHEAYGNDLLADDVFTEEQNYHVVHQNTLYSFLKSLDQSSLITQIDMARNDMVNCYVYMKLDKGLGIIQVDLRTYQVCSTLCCDAHLRSLAFIFLHSTILSLPSMWLTKDKTYWFTYNQGMNRFLYFYF